VTTPSAEPRFEDATREEIDEGRILAAVAYLPGLCFVGFAAAPANRYVQFHARQGLILFGIDVAAWIGLAIVGASVGRIPYLGLVITAVAQLAVGLMLLAVTVYGVAKGASGTFARIPFLGDGIEKVPF
jgi:uncharacterized membrane protein